VSANSELRSAFETEGKALGLDVYFPSRALSTDNAAMIAAAGYPRFLAGDHADITLNAEPNLSLA
jgi:N6-L-threonylcarbamoyladenine synthase